MANIWQFRPIAGVSGAGEKAGTSFEKSVLDAAGGSPLLAKLLAQRGLTTVEDINAFLNLEDYQPTSGWELPDMKPAVERTIQAIQNKEPILVYGDFDVDGITGTSIFYETLKYLGANVSFYIPDRAKEGHGLNTAACVRLVSTRQVKLVITTDTGITNFNEVSLLNGLKVDTIVTDHHELPENLPPAIANVNPKCFTDQSHPLAPLCGAGVAYKMCELLLEALDPQNAQRKAEELLDLTAVGTVADLASLLKENRYLVYQGLKVMNRRGRLGIRKILEQAGTSPTAKLTSETVGFTIGPRLNALGRLENAMEAVTLLTTQEEDKAQTIAAHLEHLNRRRRQLCDEMHLQAESYMNQGGGLDGRRAIVLASPDWNLGIIGIVASRLIEKYHVPVFMMVVDESKGEARCSARSIPNFHLHDEVSKLQHYFSVFGGHAGAGGFTLKLSDLDRFKQDLYTLTNNCITDEDMKPIIDVDAKLEWSQLNPHLVEMVAKMAPFGMDNPAPKFVLENVAVASQRSLGEEARHLKLMLTQATGSKTAAGQQPNVPIEGLIWNAEEKLQPGNAYHFVVQPELNTFNNVTKVQLIIDDYRPAIESAAGTSQAAHAPKVQNLLKHPAAAVVPAVNAADTVKWIDHRSRDGIEGFLGQLMMPKTGESVRVFHEGKKPEIPFLKAEALMTRAELSASETLVLWDLPPNLAVFQQILETCKPTVIHVVGGKYQSVPLFQTEMNFLKVILQGLKRYQAETQSDVVNFETLSMQLATSVPVINAGVILLSKLGMLTTGVLPESPNAMTYQITLNASAAQISTQWTQHLEFHTFQTALQEVSQFRNWLFNVPLATIKDAVYLSTLTAAPAEASIPSSAKEAQNYAPSVRNH